MNRQLLFYCHAKAIHQENRLLVGPDPRTRTTALKSGLFQVLFKKILSIFFLDRNKSKLILTYVVQAIGALFTFSEADVAAKASGLHGIVNFIQIFIQIIIKKNTCNVSNLKKLSKGVVPSTVLWLFHSTK